MTQLSSKRVHAVALLILVSVVSVWSDSHPVRRIFYYCHEVTNGESSELFAEIVDLIEYNRASYEKVLCVDNLQHAVRVAKRFQVSFYLVLRFAPNTIYVSVYTIEGEEHGLLTYFRTKNYSGRPVDAIFTELSGIIAEAASLNPAAVSG